MGRCLTHLARKRDIYTSRGKHRRARSEQDGEGGPGGRVLRGDGVDGGGVDTGEGREEDDNGDGGWEGEVIVLWASDHEEYSRELLEQLVATPNVTVIKVCARGVCACQLRVT